MNQMQQKYLRKLLKFNQERFSKGLVMKKKNYIYIALLLIIVITLVIYFIVSNNNRKMNSRAEELYAYFNTGDLDICDGLFNYSDKKISEEQLDSATKICLAYKKSDTSKAESFNVKKDKKDSICTVEKMKFRTNDDEKECTYTKLEKNVLNESYNKLFGKDIPTDIKSFQADQLHICYLKDDEIVCGLSETFTYILGSDIDIYRSVKSIEEKGSELIMYDYFLKVIDNNCYNYYTTTESNNSCSEIINKIKGNKIKYKFLKKYGTLYKHVFNKGNDNVYHWVSSEPIK